MLRKTKRSLRCLSTSHPNVQKNTYFQHFPESKTNTVVNFGQQGYKYVIERFGKFNRVENSGIFLTLPIFEEIKSVDTRQKVIDVARLNSYTADNVSVSVAAQLYLTVVDVEKTCYNVSEPLIAVVSQAQSALRTAIGKHQLDRLLEDRNGINNSVLYDLQHSSEQWGIVILRFEITELTPDLRIQEAMDLQSTAERKRRAMVVEAEGKRKAMELEAEGKRIALLTEVDSMKTASALLDQDTSSLLNYQMNTKYLDMMRQVAGKGAHSTYFVNRDMTTLPAWMDSFTKK